MKPLVKVAGNRIEFFFKKTKKSYLLTGEIRQGVDDCQKLVDDIAFGDSLEFYERRGLVPILESMGAQKRFYSEVFLNPPARHGYPKSARSNPEWEEACLLWNGQCRRVLNRNFRFC